MKKIFYIVLFFLAASGNAQSPVKIALLKYGGGGDWYANPTSLPNLVKFCNANMGTNIGTEIPTVDPGSSDIFNFPFVHMTGHGNVIFSVQEVENLRQYMLSGGFLHIDDNYGMDIFIRPQIKKIFPEYELIEIPFNHAIYHQQFDFANGLPKIHEHDAKPPKGYGIVVDGRIVLFYTHECDLGDGWESPDVHNDSQETRAKALQMGANIIRYVFNGD
ncbi:MAG: hypothetical protein A2W93_08300 [Bacteroidetes bacterium GWF2_43_63]|nr:MAG: hypothetical protein A2W94_04955 [Bacteroidetes bacterium GWE2_42_42]OFY55610.1 MAG: hypothetical protein A2W93_08300 [Bacteroidetes bacterium GWF2_43_63]HBG71629.1 hypothetical protein [Bacteroidales bacterium]HCB62162.1 hypothetical protein [Bacteroidales bacterium]HCY22390.1 hypothetical protein [Bacteroidales bacterium]